MKTSLLIAICIFVNVNLLAQHENHQAPKTTLSSTYAQPLLAQAVRIKDALAFLGSPLHAEDAARIEGLRHKPFTQETIDQVQQILDPYCLALCDINPESRVKVARGMAPAKLIQGGWVSYLVKVNNDAGVTAQLEVESANAQFAMFAPSLDPKVDEKKKLTSGQVANRFLEMKIYRHQPMLPNLSGLKLEYAILQVYCKDAGKREAEIGLNIGQGTQDIGFRNVVNILFDSKPSVTVTFHIKDEDGSPTMASFVITDGIERLLDDSVTTVEKADFRLKASQMEYWRKSKSLTGIYPLPSRRVAAYDEYPDFFFHPQVYRADGEHVLLPAGKYNVAYTRGPEYVTQTKEIIVPEGAAAYEVSFQLKRWINLEKQGWYSADHHVHAAGCSHYDSPEEGVKPVDMFRQALGEDLNVAAVLAWGPSWYHQKTFFTGKDAPLSTSKNIMRHDVEVSGFPSSHAGHVVLLRLTEDDYPGTTQIEEWPTWTLPVFNWAKSQNAVTGYAHSGWGLEPQSPTNDFPNYVIPKMDGIGANEYVVTVTKNVVDFFSAGDTPASWELNMWYHTLNCGLTTRLSGETDFPCIFDERVGLARSYFKTDNALLSYDGYVDAIKKGRSFVSDGRSYILDFKVNGLEPGMSDSKLSLKNKQPVNVSARIAAYLPQEQNEEGASIAGRSGSEQPYWHLERSRIASTRKVPVELIVNGIPVDNKEIAADGNWADVSFSYTIEKSSWVAMRIYPSSHTNPVFVAVNNKPIYIKKSAAWCRDAVDQCWKMKQSKIRETEKAAAKQAYDEARQFYDKIYREN